MTRAADLVLRTLAHLEPERHVAEHAQVLERGVVLEDEADLAALRRQAGGVLAVDLDRTGVGALQATDDPQQGGLAAAARAEQGGQAPAGHVQADVVQRDEVAEPLVDVRDGDAHQISFFGLSREITVMQMTEMAISTSEIW